MAPTGQGRLQQAALRRDRGRGGPRASAPASRASSPRSRWTPSRSRPGRRAARTARGIRGSARRSARRPSRRSPSRPRTGPCERPRVVGRTRRVQAGGGQPSPRARVGGQVLAAGLEGALEPFATLPDVPGLPQPGQVGGELHRPLRRRADEHVEAARMVLSSRSSRSSSSRERGAVRDWPARRAVAHAPAMRSSAASRSPRRARCSRR
jgi:hypothetical protein